MLNNVFTRLWNLFFHPYFCLCLWLVSTSAVCLHLRSWCACKLLCSEVFFTYEIASNLDKFPVAWCMLVCSLKKTILTTFLYRLLENCRGAILNSLSLSHSHPSMPGPPSLQPSVQFLSFCWSLCLQTWTIAGEKIPSPASIQYPTVPEIPTRGWKISPVRYSAYFHSSLYLLFC